MKLRRPTYIKASRRAIWGAGITTFTLLALPLLFGEYYYFQDLGNYEGGILCELKARLSAGDGLLLSPVLGNGSPLLADPQAQVLYPLRWLQLLFPLNLGQSIGPIIHLSLAAIAAAWLARTFRFRPLVSYCAGVSFALCGTCLNLMVHGAYVIGAAWIPLVWAAGRRVLARPRSRGALSLVILGIASCLLGGEPQSLAVAAGILLIELLVYAVRHRGRRWLELAARIGLAIASGTAIGYSAWAPARVELELTARLQSGFQPRMAMHWAFGPPEWPATIFPGILTEPLVQGNDLYMILSGDTILRDWNPTPYLGVLVVLCGMMGVPTRRGRTPALVLSLALLAALGTHTAAYPAMLQWIPLLRVFRFPQKFLVAVSLASILLAAGGCGELYRGRRRRAFVASGLVFSIATALLLILIARNRSGIDSSMLPSSENLVGHRTDLSTMLLERMGWSLCFAAAGLGVVLRGRRATLLLPLLITADLVLCAPNAIQTGPDVLDTTSPLAALVSKDTNDGPVFCMDPKIENSTLEGGSDWGSALARRILDLYNFNACDQVATATVYSALTTSMEDRLYNGLSLSKTSALRAYGCTQVVTTWDSRWEGLVDETPVPKLAPMGIRILPLGDPVPRAFAVKNPLLAADEAELIQRLAESTATSETLRQIDDPLHRLSHPDLPPGEEVAIAGVDWPQRSVAKVTATGKGGAVIGLRTSFRAGWHASQGGRELPLVRATGNNIATVVGNVDDGPILFEYRLPGARAAFISLAVGLAIWVVLLASGLTPRPGRQRGGTGV